MDYRLTDLRTKEELKYYLLSQGLDASADAIENLKKQYENKQIVRNALTMQELDDVAGGVEAFLIPSKNGEKTIVKIFSDGKPQFRAYYVTEDNLINGKIDYATCRAENDVPIDTIDYNSALLVAKEAIGKIRHNGKDVYGNTPGKEFTKESEYILYLGFEQVGRESNAESDDGPGCIIM